MPDKKRGIIPVFIILAVIVGVTTVGGGYYVVSKRSQVEKKQVTKQEAIKDTSVATAVKSVEVPTKVTPTPKVKPKPKIVSKVIPVQAVVPAPDIQIQQTAGTMSVKVTIDKDGDGISENTIHNTDGVLDREEFDARIQAGQ